VEEPEKLDRLEKLDALDVLDCRRGGKIGRAGLPLMRQHWTDWTGTGDCRKKPANPGKPRQRRSSSESSGG
jgi:hypothetical protein